jgi:hypothetical protein
VLSGGTWNAPALDAAYSSGSALPELYAGAPDWVADPVLNPRAQAGLLSFCYWWNGGSWQRGESPAAAESDRAVPGVWTAATMIDIVAGQLSDAPDDDLRAAVTTLLSAAEAGVVTRDTVLTVFGGFADADIDGAMYQLSMAGVAAMLPEPMAEREAVDVVSGHILSAGYDTTGYPLQDLVADRVSCGWMVYVPVASGRIAIGRAIFYVADDGVLEHSSSSVAPSVYVAEFEKRYQQRHAARV